MSTITTLRELIGAMADYPHKTDMVRKWALEAIDIVATLQSETRAPASQARASEPDVALLRGYVEAWTSHSDLDSATYNMGLALKRLLNKFESNEDAQCPVCGWVMYEKNERSPGGAPRSASVPRDFAERCRPAARVWADRTERATRNPSLPAHYAPVLVAEADRARKLLDEIDAILGPSAATESTSKGGERG